MVIKLKKIIEFKWDRGNIDKSYLKHGITPKESEEIFLDENLQVTKDIKHSQKEERFIGIGKNFKKKTLFTVFTIRKNKMRIISARTANKKERRKYNEKIKKNS